MNFVIAEYFIIIIILFLIIITSIVKSFYKDLEKFICFYISDLLVIFLLVVNYILIKSITLIGFEQEFIFYNLIVVDYSTQIIKILLINIIIFLLFVSVNYLKYEYLLNLEYLFIIFFIIISGFLLISSNDLILLFIAIELQSISFYILASFDVGSYKSTEAGLKYFFIGAFASILFLIAISFIYFIFGTTNIQNLIILSNKNLILDNFFFKNIYLSSNLFLFASLFIKIGVAPFHLWLADVYEGVLTSVTMLFVSFPKIIFIYVIIKKFIVFIVLNDFLIYLFYYCSILSIILGSFAALYQVNIKRLLAYSAVTHMGFIFISIIIGTVLSLISIYLYMYIYILLGVSIFLIVLSLRMLEKELFSINEFIGLYKTNSIMAFSLILILFSFVGIPPLAGFYGKAFVLNALMEMDFINISLLYVLLSGISGFYYLRIIKIIIYESKEKWIFYKNVTKSITWVVSIAIWLNLFFFYYYDKIIIIISYLII